MFAGVGWLLAASMAFAVPQSLDYIVAVVDDDVVLASELVSRGETVRGQMEAAGMPMPPDEVLFNQLLERLIMESLQLQMGERAGVRIDDEQLTEAIGGIAQQNGLNLAQFREALANDGMDYREFREDVRREMIIQRVQRNRVNSRIRISEEEIDAFLASPVGQAALSDEFRVGHILIAVEDNAGEETVLQAEARALGVYDQLIAGQDFRQTAIAESAGSRALEGGDMGWRPAGEMPSLFADLVLEMNVGDTSRPIRSGSGFHIIQLLDKRGASTQVVAQSKVKHILVSPSEIRSDAQTQALSEDIHGRIGAGEDFGDLARTYSEDPGSALAGGELGWSSSDQFVTEFAAVMNSVEIDEVSRPFKTQFGWHILVVTERRQQDMSEEAKRNMAVRILHTRRFEEELQNWLAEIRDEAFVEMRLDTTQ
jgi:peptidyl-prolyl cis-trans isomerase SurA